MRMLFFRGTHLSHRNTMQAPFNCFGGETLSTHMPSKRNDPLSSNIYVGFGLVWIQQKGSRSRWRIGIVYLDGIQHLYNSGVSHRP